MFRLREGVELDRLLYKVDQLSIRKAIIHKKIDTHLAHGVAVVGLVDMHFRTVTIKTNCATCTGRSDSPDSPVARQNRDSQRKR